MKALSRLHTCTKTKQVSIVKVYEGPVQTAHLHKNQAGVNCQSLWRPCPEPTPAQKPSRCQLSKSMISMKALSRPHTCTKTKQVSIVKVYEGPVQTAHLHKNQAGVTCQSLWRPCPDCTPAQKPSRCQLAKSMKALSRTHTCTKPKGVSWQIHCRICQKSKHVN